MSDRGMIKWAPFNSVTSTEKLVKELELKRKKVKKPTLSSDQIDNINNIIIESFYNKSKVMIKFYQNGYFYIKTGLITKIESINKSIILDNHFSLYLNQILNIKTL